MKLSSLLNTAFMAVSLGLITSTVSAQQPTISYSTGTAPMSTAGDNFTATFDFSNKLLELSNGVTTVTTALSFTDGQQLSFSLMATAVNASNQQTITLSSSAAANSLTVVATSGSILSGEAYSAANGAYRYSTLGGTNFTVNQGALTGNPYGYSTNQLTADNGSGNNNAESSFTTSSQPALSNGFTATGNVQASGFNSANHGQDSVSISEIPGVPEPSTWIGGSVFAGMILVVLICRRNKSWRTQRRSYGDCYVSQ